MEFTMTVESVYVTEYIYEVDEPLPEGWSSMDDRAKANWIYQHCKGGYKERYEHGEQEEIHIKVEEGRL